MNAYILGAGASRHAGYPLARDLGIALHNWVSQTKAAGHDFRNHLDLMSDLYGGLGNMEHILTDLDECLPGSRAAALQRPIRASLLASFQQAMREFLNAIREAPAPLYERLARECLNPGDVIITFNWETACERELKRAGLWEISEGYGFLFRYDGIPATKVKVLKPHGSANWWGLIFGGKIGGFSVGSDSNSLGSRPTIFFRPDLKFLGYADQIRDPECGDVARAVGIPAIIMPTFKKQFFVQTSRGREWETFWQSLWQQAEYALASAERITIIGYGMPEADKDARKLLLEKSNRNAHITICSGSASAGIRDEFGRHGFSDIRTIGQGRFEDFLGEFASGATSTN
jgi:hypothetical protein